MKKIGLGLIGLGYVGKTHFRSCLRLRSAELVAVADISKRALSSAKRMGVKNTYRDYQHLLKDKRVDAVIIALPTHLHAACAQEAAEAGKDIFLEKPLARNVAEGDEIVSRAKKHSVSLMIGYPLRFMPEFCKLKDTVSSGVLGDIQTAYASMISQGPFVDRAESRVPHPVPSWWFKKELVGGGALIDQGSHMINLLRWYMGEIVNAVSYLGYRFNLDIEDHAVCMLNFKSGKTAILNVGWYSLENQTKVELYGSVSHAVASHHPSNRVFAAFQLLAGATPKFEIPYLLELQHFTRCVRMGLPPSPSGKEALQDLKAISLVYQDIRKSIKK